MEENPYAPPESDVGPSETGGRIAELEQLAADYLWINIHLAICAAMHVLLLLAMFSAPRVMIPAMPISDSTYIVGVVVIGALFNIVGAVRFGHRLYHPIIMLLLGILSIVPVIGLLVFFLFRRRAIALLEDERIRVGFWLVDRESLDARISQLKVALGK